MKKIFESFEKNNNFPWSVSVSNTSKGYYYYVNEGILLNTQTGRPFTNISNINKNVKITANLDQPNTKTYIYLECNIDNKWSITSASIKESTSVLPILDGESFPIKINKIRKILAIIGELGKVSQKKNYGLNTEDAETHPPESEIAYIRETDSNLNPCLYLGVCIRGTVKGNILARLI